MRLFRTPGKKGASAQASITRGDAARDQRDWARAASAYKAALEATPDLPDIWVQYGHVLKEDGQIIQAVAAYREALRRNPGEAETQVHLAHTLKRTGDHDEALQAFQEALALDPSDEESAQELFALQRRLNKLPDAQDPGKAGATPPLAQNGPDPETALLRDRQAKVAEELRLSAARALDEDMRAENDVLKEQVQGQQAEIEKQYSLQAALTIERDELLDEMRLLKQRIEDQQVEIETLEETRGDVLATVEALRSQIRDHDARTDLAKKEFLRSEGQIALIKDMFLHKGEL